MLLIESLPRNEALIATQKIYTTAGVREPIARVQLTAARSGETLIVCAHASATNDAGILVGWTLETSLLYLDKKRRIGQVAGRNIPTAVHHDERQRVTLLQWAPSSDLPAWWGADQADITIELISRAYSTRAKNHVLAIEAASVQVLRSGL